ncbi:hypothetical protein [Paenibacillus silvisoli]|uniref:hypothetical protein n=1 Tax=Paenibacillus silvisoli TaxID=3110539 RepID=UPI0028054EEB|nr:hypothetical protein [Paenibacillus silvisoli]
MSFEVEHEKWVKKHIAKRQGERRDALRRGHGYGNRMFVDKIWWSLMGHFTGLHPEYEVRDSRGRSYFVDFMWIVGEHHFVIAMLRSILAPYLAASSEQHKYRKIERQFMRLAIRDHRVIQPSKAAKELELHKQTVIKYCRRLVDEGKLRAITTGSSGRVLQYEYLGTTQSPDVI